MSFSDEELEFLQANEMPRQRWLADSNAAPILHELAERGLMKPASGEFGAPRDKGETINLIGKPIPVVELISLYMLTPHGRQHYASA